MPPSLLIVDDHDGFRRFARVLLSADGFDVTGDVADGESALEAVGTLNPDVVLLDVQLPAEQSFDVVAQTDNAEDLVRRVGGLRPDVALVDIRMPPTFSDEGLKAALEIGDRHPGVGVVVLSQYVESGYAMRLLEDGSAGRGYLLKDRVSELDAFAEA